MSELGITLTGVAFGAFLGAFGWMINIQLKYNKEFSISLTQLSAAIHDLSKTIAVLEERDRARETRANDDANQTSRRLNHLEKQISNITIQKTTA